MKHILEHPEYRPDIDGLRAIAVLSVVVFHAFPSYLKGGFVGVDVFFVISGYLISSIIFRNLEHNNFSYLEFYSRRVKRILPALTVVLFSVLVFGWFALLSDEYKQLGKHVFSGFAFVSNFVLWSEAGYFDVAAETKPLLHLWSLAIEEQFYLIWPLLLGFVWKRAWSFLWVTALMAVISFVVSISYINSDNVVAAFYSPFSRFWELMFGGLLAYVVIHKPTYMKHFRNTQSFVGLGMIALSLVIINKERAFPGWWAILPVLGTVLVISSSSSAWLNKKLLSNKLMVWVGLISYPLYLWHWPILSFARIIEGSKTSIAFRVIAIFSSFVLGWATYRFIERPLRYSRKDFPLLLITGFSLFGLIGGFIYLNNGFEGRWKGTQYINPAQLGTWNYWNNPACDNRYPYKKEAGGWWFCYINADAPPTLLLLGDSYANHLYPGLARNNKTQHHTILSIGNFGPASRLQLAGPDIDKMNPRYQQRRDEQEIFINSIINKENIRFAILNEKWPSFNERGDWVTQKGTIEGTIKYGKSVDETAASFSAYFNGLDERIKLLEAKGISVIMFLPKPETNNYHIKDCYSRPFREATEACRTSRAEQELHRQQFLIGAKSLRHKHPNLMLFDQFDLFCDHTHCTFIKEGEPLLRDMGHLSEYGSALMADLFVKWAAENSPEILR